MIDPGRIFIPTIVNKTTGKNKFWRIIYFFKNLLINLILNYSKICLSFKIPKLLLLRTFEKWIMSWLLKNASKIVKSNVGHY